jgi:hypothetical protein
MSDQIEKAIDHAVASAANLFDAYTDEIADAWAGSVDDDGLGRRKAKVAIVVSFSERKPGVIAVKTRLRVGQNPVGEETEYEVQEELFKKPTAGEGAEAGAEG